MLVCCSTMTAWFPKLSFLCHVKHLCSKWVCPTKQVTHFIMNCFGSKMKYCSNCTFFLRWYFFNYRYFARPWNNILKCAVQCILKNIVTNSCCYIHYLCAFQLLSVLEVNNSYFWFPIYVTETFACSYFLQCSFCKSVLKCLLFRTIPFCFP